MPGWSERKRGGAVLDVAVALEPGVLDSIQEVVRTGALVSFGLSRDGGSLGVTVTFDSEWDRQWFRDPVELSAWLGACAADILEETGGELPSSPPATAQRDRKRPRGGSGGSRAK